MKSDEKAKKAGADERTPSIPQYFSWINNTNEGSTEEQTLINLEYFGYLFREYGMKIGIYAWDAGNLDGSSETYQIIGKSEKLAKQYPNGYGKIVETAAKYGIRMGVWCGPDGFGDTEEKQEERLGQMVSLCRDYHFGLFKMDGVCGHLYPEHRDLFVRMMTECRRYSPDLILLNHRLYFGEEGMKHATTSLWNGDETYVDVHMANRYTAPHHRGYFASRGNTPGLSRMMEDHGVCLSSCLDFFEDELIIQAFGRGLILAPEIYGNPWLLRDDEQAHLAYIYNLHRRFAPILTEGILLPGGRIAPEGTVVRGNATHRFVCGGNTSWQGICMNLRLDTSIGLAPAESVTVICRFPYTEVVGRFGYGEEVALPIMPYRAALYEICDSREADELPEHCAFEVLHEKESGLPERINVLYREGKFDLRYKAPVLLGRISADRFADLPENAAAQSETALFAEDHDSLEARSLARSGDTKIPEVRAARDAFFGQETYALRGCESRFAFDGNPDTYFDGISKCFFGGFRIDGGCLRVDFGRVYSADYVRIEFLDYDEERPSDLLCSVEKEVIPPVCDFSTDLGLWSDSRLDRIDNIGTETRHLLRHDIHDIFDCRFRRRRVYYPIFGDIRYFRMPKPLDRIVDIALISGGEPIALENPRANNLLGYSYKPVYCKEVAVDLPTLADGDERYISVALEGTHGTEGAVALIECDGRLYTAPDRAPGYETNVWECNAYITAGTESFYTFYFPLTKELEGKSATVRVLGFDGGHRDYGVDVWLCDKNREIIGEIEEI